MLVLKHKSFVDKHEGWFSAGFVERAWEEAERFINSIGAEKLVTVAEELEYNTVTVWYREEDDTRPSKEAMPEL